MLIDATSDVHRELVHRAVEPWRGNFFFLTDEQIEAMQDNSRSGCHLSFAGHLPYVLSLPRIVDVREDQAEQTPSLIHLAWGLEGMFCCLRRPEATSCAASHFPT